MKKLSLILALVLVLSCVLVACNDETEASSTPADESVAESVAESTPADESDEESTPADESEAESTPADESEDESTPADESEPAGDVEAGTENIALNKTYTHSVLFRQGGADKGYGHDPDAPIAYPDEDEKSLTDGVLPADDALYGSVEWVGFNSNDPDYEGYHWITVDLGESKNLAKYVFNYGTVALGSGISAPMTLEIFVSEDGTTWGDAIDGDVPENSESSVNGVLALEAAATGRYVQFRFTSGGWAFVSEVEVYAAAE